MIRPSGRVVGALLLALASCRRLLEIEDAELYPASDGGAAAGLGGAPAAQAAGAGASSDAGGETAAGAPVGGAAGAAARPEGGEAGQGGSSEPGLCEQYCTAVMSNCTAAFAVYTSYETCMSVCAVLPKGEPGARSGNSASCRLAAALNAKDEVPHYCPVAGPGGNGVCGSNCEALCELRAQVCSQYGSVDRATCQTDCGRLQDLGNYSTDLTVEQYGGPHVQCRLYHVSAAAAAEPESHCLHANGAEPCR